MTSRMDAKPLKARIPRTTVSKTKVYQDLRFRIITHNIRPEKIITEKALMKEYGIGRTPLREILIQLQRDSLIQRFPRSGTFVTPLDIHYFKQIMEIRSNLEGLAGSLAAERITAPQLAALKRILREVRGLTKNPKNREMSKKALTQCEFDFHKTIYEATHNKKLADILYELHGVATRFWFYWDLKWQDFVDQFIDLEGVIEALERKDKQMSGAILKSHVQNYLNKSRDKFLNEH